MGAQKQAFGWIARVGIWGALILILASILVPNVPPEPRRSAMNNALAEVKNAETAFTGMLSDAQVMNFRQFFDPEAFSEVHAGLMREQGLDAFDAAVRMYSTAFYAFLKHGKNATDAFADAEIEGLSRTLAPEVVRKLGTNYMELDNDPWGWRYRVFAGPWPEEWGPPVFRVRQFQADARDIQGSPKPDGLTITLGTGEIVGYPPPTQLPIYIWSEGKNGATDQALFDPTGQYTGSARDHYRPDAADDYLGGGDDINNWDLGQSWHVFYPQSSWRFGCTPQYEPFVK